MYDMYTIYYCIVQVYYDFMGMTLMGMSNYIIIDTNGITGCKRGAPYTGKSHNY